MKVLGIDVDEELLLRWREWLMPERQPFTVPRQFAEHQGWADGRATLSFEVLDAFELYRTPADDVIVWLTRAQARALADDLRRAQPAAHRWPTADLYRDVERVVRYVESGRRPSRHAEVGAEWCQSEEPPPGARAMAGTFASRSGPNCFGAVMGAAGVEGAAGQWMQLKPFEDWLTAATTSGGRDDEVGTVLVWRTVDGVPAHAAVTLGSGWLLHKPSQGWMSPTKVLTVRDGKLSARYRGRHLFRYRLRH